MKYDRSLALWFCLLSACTPQLQENLPESLQRSESLQRIGPSIVAGYTHACLIRMNGGVECWGDNSAGKATVPPDLGPVKAIGAGLDHTCAITADNSVRCWGDNSVGQQNVPAGLKATQLSLGRTHSCVVTPDSQARCWGDDYAGKSTPKDQTRRQPLGLVKAVALGRDHSCAIKTDDTVACWGEGTLAPPFGAVPANWTATAIAARDFGTCALRSIGINVCFGGVDLNIPGARGSDVPDREVLKSVVLGAGYENTRGVCVIRANDTLYCFGQNALDAIAPTLGPVAAVASGSNFDCVIKPDKLVQCFGNNAQGQTKSPRGIGSASFIASSNDHACAIEEDQTLDCFGDETSEAGIPSINPTVKAKWVATDHWQTCVILIDDTIRCFGANAQSIPATLKARSVTVGEENTCVIAVDGTASCFGPNKYGETNIAPYGPLKAVVTKDRRTCMIQANDLAKCIGREPLAGVFNIPATVGPVKSIATGNAMTCMIKADETVFCAAAPKTAPPPPDLGKVKALAVNFHGCAIRMDNTLRCWGQFGNNGDPTPPADLGQVIAVSAGASHSCAVKTNGRVVCWGAIPNNIPATLQ